MRSRLLFPFVLAVAACSSSNASNGFTGDAGKASKDGGGADTGAGDDDAGQPPPAAVTDFCTKQVTYEKRCPDNGTDASTVSAACAKGLADQCTAEAMIRSEAYATAVNKCYTSTVMCDTVSSCVDEKLTGVMPTKAQSKVRDDYCQMCEPANGQCRSGFFDPGAGGAQVGTGYVVITVNDDIANMIETQCIQMMSNQAGDTCVNDFATCLLGIYRGALPPDPDACSTN